METEKVTLPAGSPIRCDGVPYRLLADTAVELNPQRSGNSEAIAVTPSGAILDPQPE